MSDTITKDIWGCEVSPPDGGKMCGPWGVVSRGDGPGLEPWFSAGLISMDSGQTTWLWLTPAV